MLTSATRGETLTPNPNECNSTLTSGTRGIYPYQYVALEIGDGKGPPPTAAPLRLLFSPRFHADPSACRLLCVLFFSVLALY